MAATTGLRCPATLRADGQERRPPRGHKAFEKRLRQPGMRLGQGPAQPDDMHDRKETGSGVVVTFRRLEIRKQPNQSVITIQKGLRWFRGQQPVDFSGQKQVLKGFASIDRLDHHALGQVQRQPLPPHSGIQRPRYASARRVLSRQNRRPGPRASKAPPSFDIRARPLFARQNPQAKRCQSRAGQRSPSGERHGSQKPGWRRSLLPRATLAARSWRWTSRSHHRARRPRPEETAWRWARSQKSGGRRALLCRRRAMPSPGRDPS